MKRKQAVKSLAPPMWTEQPRNRKKSTKARSAGRIEIDGQSVDLKSPRQGIAHGIAYLSEDRKGKSLHVGMGLRQNLTQEALAHAAGISLSTLRRFEKTGDIALASFVEIAFALRRMDGFDALFPEPPVHSLFEAAPRERKRARRPDADRKSVV